ncbi:FAS1-like dehydratase domain-containing protein [Gephyromycinifex aptenodytis]|uniref:FAS1-like dehydratase domain-containing protein n=1 Tax=Gephyromycinifex aptenodytis TaxID=2716227 RepID=UPI001447C8EB|nr:MaoC family dehydratase N-terminal domain-containing protein [Gephyromycinifex aptenodytis]
MPVNATFEGRSYPPCESFAVGREHVRDFARAVGATDPVHFDVAAARQAGYADVIAPPTFAVVIAQRAEAQLMLDPEAGIDFSRVVHGEEKFLHHAPLVAGEEIVARLHVDRVREVAGNALVGTRVELATSEGAPRSTVTSSLVVRGEES